MTPDERQMDITGRLAGFCAELSYGDVPKEVIESAVMEEQQPNRAG